MLDEKEHDGFGEVSQVNPTGSQEYLDVEIKRRERAQLVKGLPWGTT